MAQTKYPKRTVPGAKSLRVLLVEDDPDARTALQEVLWMRGYFVTTARDGLEAERIASKRHFDVVVTDFRLPRLDGIDLIRRLARKRNPPATVLITAYWNPRTMERGFTVRAAKILIKPFRPEI